MCNKYSLVLLSGGTGSRMKESIPKQYLSLAGKPVIVHIMECLNQIDQIDEIIICANVDYFKMIDDYIENYNLERAKFKVVEAGVTRQETAFKGVLQAKNNHILLHEAARPFVTSSTFVNLIDQEEDTVIYGASIPFTVLKAAKEYVTEGLKRDELINVQLPQKFKKEELLPAFYRAREDNRVFTEEASMLNYYFNDKPIKVIEGSEYNLKITYPLDLKIGEVILNHLLNREEYL